MKEKQTCIFAGQRRLARDRSHTELPRPIIHILLHQIKRLQPLPGRQQGVKGGYKPVVSLPLTRNLKKQPSKGDAPRKIEGWFWSSQNAF
jgi:hypothetical protein